MRTRCLPALLIVMLTPPGAYTTVEACSSTTLSGKT
jgi:hypothetical protein